MRLPATIGSLIEVTGRLVEEEKHSPLRNKYDKIQNKPWRGTMFIHKIDEDLSLKLIELRDGERVFELINKSRNYLREWLPWLDATTKLEDQTGFIKLCLKGF